MKEEDKIQKKIGTENPFRVPEGYFENLTSEVMNRLPEKEKLIAVQTEPTMWQKVRPWLYMTAMFIGAALIIRVASSEHTPSVERMAADDTETEMEYINIFHFCFRIISSHTLYRWSMLRRSYTDNQCRTYKHGGHIQPRPYLLPHCRLCLHSNEFLFFGKPVHYL